MKKDKNYYVNLLTDFLDTKIEAEKNESELIKIFGSKRIEPILYDKEILAFSANAELARLAEALNCFDLSKLLSLDLQERARILKNIRTQNKYMNFNVWKESDTKNFLLLKKDKKTTIKVNYTTITIKNDEFTLLDNSNYLNIINNSGLWSYNEFNFSESDYQNVIDVMTSHELRVNNLFFHYNKSIIKNKKFTNAVIGPEYLKMKDFLSIATSSQMRKQPDVIKNAKILL